MSACPALRRTEGGFVCNYTEKPIDPFGWYCIGNYTECPVYVRYKKEVRQEPPKIEAVAQIAPPQPREIAADFERAIKPAAENIISKYDDVVKKLDAAWQDYESSVMNYRRQWDLEKTSLLRIIDVLNNTISSYEKLLNELELRSELLPESSFSDLRNEILQKLDNLRNLLYEIENKYKTLEEGLNIHFKRVLNTSTNAEVLGLRISIRRLEELLKEGRISAEVYEELKRELEAYV